MGRRSRTLLHSPLHLDTPTIFDFADFVDFRDFDKLLPVSLLDFRDFD
jgi:hypothetical protein